MFSLFNGIYDSYLAPSQLNLLVIGAPSAGKTTLLERLKVTHFPKRPPSSQSPPLSTEGLTPALRKAFADGGVSCTAAAMASEVSPQKPKAPAPTIVVTQKRRFPLICPAPERYRRSTQDQEEDFIEEDGDSLPPEEEDDKNSTDQEEMKPLIELPLEAPLVGSTHTRAPIRVRCHSKEFSMDDIDVMHNDENNNSMEDIPISNNTDAPPPQQQQPQEETLEQGREPINSPLLQSSFEEYHVKSNGKMLPMSKIRPTIGTNLAKLDMYSAKCHFFDVGGRMKSAWESYYGDCDAVIFCWKLGDDPDADDDHDDDEEEPFDLTQQQQILTEVRKSIPDDIPFLIFGHVFGNVNLEITNKMYSTNAILPHYHNPMTGLCCGSAKTGAGVQPAMEWLIPLAKRQQKERLAARKQLKDV